VMQCFPLKLSDITFAQEHSIQIRQYIPEDIVEAMVTLHQQTDGHDLGCRAMTTRLRNIYNINVARDAVAAAQKNLIRPAFQAAENDAFPVANTLWTDRTHFGILTRMISFASSGSRYTRVLTVGPEISNGCKLECPTAFPSGLQPIRLKLHKNLGSCPLANVLTGVQKTVSQLQFSSTLMATAAIFLDDPLRIRGSSPGGIICIQEESIFG